MSESQGRSCPECGAPRGPDLSPSCDCAERAAEALRETRTAEAAAAEDFGPLRIRPYVAIEPGETGPPLQPAGRHPEGARGRAPAGGSAAWARPATTAPQPNDDPPRPNRPSARRAVLLSVAGAGTAIVAAAGFASGLLSYHTPSRDRAAQEVRQSVPQVSTPGPASPTPPSSPALSHRPAPPPAASASLSRPPSPSATPSTSPTPAPPAVTSRPAPATASAAPRTTAAVAPVLQRGDQGSEVTELQQRLRQLNLYADRINGVFTRPVEDAVRTYQLARGVQGDTLGVYGPATRRGLEAETSEP
ncbi:peptidoglycan-binding protein [Streptomyces sp. NPDC059680]|uniref:peptidoglycan-binding domain-containing protein n=1 Tax=Streptomyces sp. NPDC059680 TaxID=3346904 RepID=UPI0036CA0D61